MLIFNIKWSVRNMRGICHVCPAGDAELRVRALVGEERVLALVDDLAIGPLADIDQSSPQARVAFWQNLFAVSPLDIDWQCELQRDGQRLSALAHGAGEVVIWHGTHASEWLMNLRVHHWLQASPVPVSEVCVGETGVEPLALAMLEDAGWAALPTRRRLIAAEERQVRAREWGEWREAGRGVRDWLAGSLQERPLSCHDDYLVSLAGAAARPLPRLLGQAMAETGRSDTFCLWRVSCLLADGRLRLLQGNLAQWQQAIVLAG
ncbi:hypothetical protein THUN1379_26050 [Paludibacterium sp. THUN1379]|nr:hypothetical protein THUN1379_26050 [Paludibacterium sp. THUN1379]